MLIFRTIFVVFPQLWWNKNFSQKPTYITYIHCPSLSHKLENSKKQFFIKRKRLVFALIFFKKPGSATFFIYCFEKLILNFWKE